MTDFTDVGLFHTKFGLPVSEGIPKEVSSELLEFRMAFMLEELLEFAEGAGYELALVDRFNGPPSRSWQFLVIPDAEPDHAKMFDALIDKVYIDMGTAHLFGYPWVEGWEQVQTANMAKVRAQADGSDSKRSSSFDVVKPEGWTAPDIAGLLYECGWPDTRGFEDPWDPIHQMIAGKTINPEDLN